MTSTLLATVLVIGGSLVTGAAAFAEGPEDSAVAQQEAAEVSADESAPKADTETTPEPQERPAEVPAPESPESAEQAAPAVTEQTNSEVVGSVATEAETPASVETPRVPEAATKRVSTQQVPNLSPCVAGANPTGATPVTAATLDWGVKQSYRNYLTGPIAHGSIENLGSTTGQFSWNGGTGNLLSTGSAGAFGFGVGNGVHFVGHLMDGGYALDQTFTNPCVEIVSDSKANLYLDVNSRKFESMTSLSQEWFEQDGVLFATIDLDSAPIISGGTTTWQNAPATLTDAGSIAFGGFYPVGDSLDPVTFSVPFEIEPPAPTTVHLQSSTVKAVEKSEVVLTATTQPADLAGTVTFSSGEQSLGPAVQVQDGKAVLNTKSLPVGLNKVRAHFSPENSIGYVSSRSNTVEVTVSEIPTPVAPDGMLEWGVKSSFRSYVNGPIAHGKITVQKPATQNAAKTTYKFPQATGGTWNGSTGTVQYAGNVNFYGHEGAMNVDLANPVISVKSSTAAELSVKFKKKNIVLATIDLKSAKRTALQGGAVNFAGAKATLSKAGAEDYFAYEGPEGIGGFYEAGDALDAMTFTIGKPTETNIVNPDPKDPTNTNKPMEKPAGPVATGTGQAAGSLRWGVSSAFANYVTGPIAKGDISTSGVGNSEGAYLFPQADGGNWNATSQTGTVQYSGVITFTGHKGLLKESVSNPMIEVTSATSGVIYSGGARWGTLDLAAASKSVGANGEVTWSGVPVAGGFSGGASGGSQYTLGADPLTFTVGSASGVSYGSTQKGESTKKRRIAADIAPATTGITVLTEASKLKPGGRIELEAQGFEADDEGVLVVLYKAKGSKPILLDEGAKADKSGNVAWSGTLPKDTTGEYTITLQGSVNAGAMIDILDAKQAKKKAAASATQVDEAAVQASGFVGGAQNNGMSTWEWWASAGGLVVIAACMTLLAIRQRRLS
ncbi:hypothetical protein G7068_07020 [Leucobacter viscericola]|uniref:Htaa protein n=1 Tax=Leucobacter viscericola TaxID=2714935 RepID=A0A6G7XEJ7_9MICO|nr:HtaA domain-containing protein [Leucobacter viscericola]QIK62973.1 hypothetical protein G7068_07020 [Leucobacter viscericola]